MTEARPQTGFLDVQGAPLYYEVAGTGHPLLLIHAGHELIKQLVVEIPQAQQVVISNAAHVANMEQPGEFNRIVLEFLKNCST